MVIYEFLTGRPETVASTLRRRLSAYTRHDRARRFKIGITNNPDRRYREAYARAYKEMIVLYRTSSYRYICQLERDLIEHNWEVCENLVGGGGGCLTDGPFYLYVVRSC